MFSALQKLQRILAPLYESGFGLIMFHFMTGLFETSAALRGALAKWANKEMLTKAAARKCHPKQ
jgi:hypothetical protein